MIDGITTDIEGIEVCDFTNPYHCGRLCEMVNNFILDPMGFGKPLSDRKKLHLLDGLESHPMSIVLLAVEGEKVVGFVSAFINFSTFLAAPVMNVHDIFVENEYRRNGWSVKLFNQLIRIAQTKRCAKITLEVRKDNTYAQHLYLQLGFHESDSPMFF